MTKNSLIFILFFIAILPSLKGKESFNGALVDAVKSGNGDFLKDWFLSVSDIEKIEMKRRQMSVVKLNHDKVSRIDKFYSAIRGINARLIAEGIDCKAVEIVKALHCSYKYSKWSTLSLKDLDRMDSRFTYIFTVFKSKDMYFSISMKKAFALKKLNGKICINSVEKKDWPLFSNWVPGNGKIKDVDQKIAGIIVNRNFNKNQIDFFFGSPARKFKDKWVYHTSPQKCEFSFNEHGVLVTVKIGEDVVDPDKRIKAIKKEYYKSLIEYKDETDVMSVPIIGKKRTSVKGELKDSVEDSVDTHKD